MVVLVFLLALAASSPADTSENCRLTSSINGQTLEYDINLLKRVNGPGVPNNLHANWFSIETHDEDASLDNVDDYTYFFNLCGPLLNVPSFLGERISAFGSDIGVIQRVEDDTTDDDDNANDNDITDGYVLGRRQNSPGLRRLMDGDLRYTFAPAETHLPSPNSPSGWINTSRHCDDRQTTILLFCADVGLGSPVFAYEGAQCDYVFVWNTCAACSLDTQIRKNCPNKTAVCDSGASPFRAIVILILAFLLVYLVVGCLFNRFARGARGIDQIPHVSFCQSITAKIPCCKSRAQHVAPIKYQGLDDGNDDIDDDADDNFYDIGR